MSVVYFIRGGDRIKIGTSRQLESRFGALRSSSPVDLEILATVPGDRVLEQSLHRELAKHRVNFEWFSDCVEVHAAMHRVVKELNGTLSPEIKTAPAVTFFEDRPARERKPWDGMDFDQFGMLTDTITDITDRFDALIASPAARDARRVRELEYQLGLPDGELLGRIYQCDAPAESHSAAVKVLKRNMHKFHKVSDRAFLDLGIGDTSRVGPLCEASKLLIERAELAFLALNHVAGALQQTKTSARATGGRGR